MKTVAHKINETIEVRISAISNDEAYVIVYDNGQRIKGRRSFLKIKSDRSGAYVTVKILVDNIKIYLEREKNEN